MKIKPNSNIRYAEISAVITRGSTGQKKDLGVISLYHKRRSKRLAWRVAVKLRALARRINDYSIRLSKFASNPD